MRAGNGFLRPDLADPPAMREDAKILGLVRQNHGEIGDADVLAISGAAKIAAPPCYLCHARISPLYTTRRSASTRWSVQPGEWMRLRDLISGGEAVQVMKRSSSLGLRLRAHLATRVVPLQGHKVASGVLIVFKHRESEALRAAFHRAGKRAPRGPNGTLQQQAA